MSTTSTGRGAELKAADFLKSKGFKVVDLNWRRKCCEIDLVARKCQRKGFKNHCVVHIVEVKFRKSDRFGNPEEFVTSAKQRRLKKAAEHWSQENQWNGSIQIDVIGIDGYTITYIPNITV